MKSILFFILLTISSMVFSQSAVDDFINQPILKNALISISVVDLTNNKSVQSYRADYPITPASTLKVITTATILEKLGQKFQYETTIAYKGKIVKNQLIGDLYIIGSGDPTLASYKIGKAKDSETDPRKELMNEWSAKIKQAGILKIKGNIIADISCFDTVGVNPKWTWDDIGNYYAPGIYGISYLDNTVKVKFSSGAIGSKTKIVGTDPLIPEMTFKNSVMSSDTKSDNAYFFGIPGEYLRYVSGEIPANKESFIVKCDLPRPGLLLASDLKTALSKAGVEVGGIAVQNSLSAGSTTKLFTHKSPDLIDIITETNMKSNNHYAECLFRTLGALKEKPATIKTSIKEIKSFWGQKGLPANQLQMTDGCGLSPNNAVSANYYTQLLVYMYKSKNKDAFVNSLPVSGMSGSLSGVLKNTRLQGKIYAKSGTIDNVKAYAGYIFDENHKYAFAVMVNNSSGSSWQVLSKIEEFLLKL